MRTIAVLNPKGGAGKSTISICLARALEQRGSVLLVDADPQGTVRDWHGIDGQNPTSVVALDSASSLRGLPSLGGHDYAVIDAAGRADDLTAAAVRIADLVLMPAQPSPADLWALEPLVSVVQQRQEVTGGAPMAGVVVNRAVKGTVLSRIIGSALDDLGVDRTDTTIHQRQVFAQALNSGKTPFELEPEGEAAHEIRKLGKEVARLFE